MQPREALEILGLQSDATPELIKETYRDLVKVWHPDRFGSDPQLRGKAEVKLSQINTAYRTLQSFDRTVESHDQSVAAEATAASPGVESVVRNEWLGSLRAWVLPVFLCGLVGLPMIALATYAYVVSRSLPPPEPQQVGQPASLGKTAMPAEVAGDLPSRRLKPAASSPDETRTPPFRIRVLSEAETAQIEAVCSSKRRGHNLAAYSACVRAELSRSGAASDAGDQSGLSEQERDAIDSACSAEGQRQDDSAYARCVAWQMSDLETSPSRPDFSTVSEADRRSMETACGASKREGPVAYDRCLVRMIRALARSR